MLANRPIRLSIPARDLARAKQFYADKLGLTPSSESEFGLNYRSENGLFTIVPSESAGQASYSLLTWIVDDIETMMSAMRTQGIEFEDYDLPFLKTVNGIADFGQDKVAWFKDSEGNLLAIAQVE
jgi:catechol 2,3-dioxygenase-like lactoylglutathione lyase family enzyme